MNFFENLLISLSAFFSGGAVASVFCIVFAKILKKKYLKARFSIIFVFLSIAIASFTANFFVDSGFLGLFPLKIGDLLFFLAIFVLGALITAFWKVALPVFVLIYVAATAFFGYSFYSAFGILPDDHQITITKTEVFVDDEAFSILESGVGDGSVMGAGANAENVRIEAEVFVLKERILLPLPRVWYKIRLEGSEKEVKLDAFSSLAVGKHFFTPVNLPDFSVMPAVFNLKCVRTFENVLFSSEKSI